MSVNPGTVKPVALPPGYKLAASAPLTGKIAAPPAAKPGLLILAPGPINRGVEVTPEVADGNQSAILRQVSNGLVEESGRLLNQTSSFRPVRK